MNDYNIEEWNIEEMNYMDEWNMAEWNMEKFAEPGLSILKMSCYSIFFSPITILFSADTQNKSVVPNVKDNANGTDEECTISKNDGNQDKSQQKQLPPVEGEPKYIQIAGILLKTPIISSSKSSDLKKILGRPHGMFNLGNTCWASSAFMILKSQQWFAWLLRQRTSPIVLTIELVLNYSQKCSNSTAKVSDIT